MKEGVMIVIPFQWWVALGSLLLIAGALCNTPRAKAARARSREERRRQGEERKEKERVEAAQKALQIENFRKQHLVVYIREKDGRKSGFEAVLIRALLKEGVSVQFLRDNDGRAIVNADAGSLKDGLLALVGTSWCKEHTAGGYDSIDGYVEKFQSETTYCDYRLLTASAGVVNILGSGYGASPYLHDLANAIVKDLVPMVPLLDESKQK